eukprot:TRINITY_DN4431_c0_g1_i1.p1 TRINITY_DN4431_c0_g1~~TRINITY_DN4431_c0_g1_i1.p1  ORF type:complete len:380 (+),score=95.29 TRINITY_DN4431_c0_g1_i1:90-1229(+)
MSSRETDSMIGSVWLERFQVVKKVGAGSFGVIYRVLDLGRTKSYFAMKFENLDALHPQLSHEARILRTLRGIHGIPDTKFLGKHQQYRILLMDLLGKSLEELFNLCERRFSLPCVIKIAIQLLERMKVIHAHGYIHRDIKPDNFLIGHGARNDVVHVIDFGLAKRYTDKITGCHIPFIDGKSLVGTPRYASLATHRGEEQSRRDDLESLGYVLVYFLVGKLPWQGLKARSKKTKYRKIKRKKETTCLDELTRNIPREFYDYLKYCRDLKFTEMPDYDGWVDKFRALGRRFDGSLFFDWMRPEVVARIEAARLHSSYAPGGYSGGENYYRAPAPAAPVQQPIRRRVINNSGLQFPQPARESGGRRFHEMSYERPERGGEL